MKRKIILGTSNASSTSHLSQRTSEPAYYIVYCRIFRPSYGPLYEGIPFNDVAAFSQLYRAKSATRVRLIILLTESDNQFEKKNESEFSQNFRAIFSLFIWFFGKIVIG